MICVRSARQLARVLLLIAWPALPVAAASLDALAGDGLYTWRVAATDDAPPWCCYHWTGGSPVARACDLDSRNSNYGSAANLSASGEMQIYALVTSGKAARIRVLSPQCSVTSRHELTDLGAIDNAASLAWLTPNVAPRSDTSADALAAIAVHRSPAAMRYLRVTAETGNDTDLRKDAIFWMSQTRMPEAADDLERLMFRDDSAVIRQHAAFAVAQSSATKHSELLIRQGREDAAAEVRSQAWFWLAQSGADESEAAIRQAMANDRDDEVREQAVFALSQLPGERAVDALLAVVRDRQLDREARERALFWLAQSDSARAYEYLDRLLASGRP